MLIVDDVEVNRRILERQLSAFGMIVSHADDGFAAIAALERAWHFGCPFDLAIVDYMMPGLSGDQIAARIRAIPAIAEIKLILSSSAGGHGLSPTAAADAVLAKPLREHDLLECFAKLFGGAVTAGSQEQAAAVTQDPAEGRLRILIVEDNSINQRLLSVLLTKAGHDVTLAENGQQAVDAVAAQDFDVVLMDCLLYTSPSPRDRQKSRMPSSA